MPAPFVFGPGPGTRQGRISPVVRSPKAVLPTPDTLKYQHPQTDGSVPNRALQLPPPSRPHTITSPPHHHLAPHHHPGSYTRHPGASRNPGTSTSAVIPASPSRHQHRHSGASRNLTRPPARAAISCRHPGPLNPSSRRQPASTARYRQPHRRLPSRPLHPYTYCTRPSPAPVRPLHSVIPAQAGISP